MKAYPVYKDTGIEWLGKIPEQWQTAKLKYIAFLKSGESIKSEQIKMHGEFQVFGGNGLRGYYHKYTHDDSCILIGRQGALCGNINYAKGKFWASEHAIVVKVFFKSGLKWLGELLNSMNLNQYSQSAAQPGLSVDFIKNLVIPMPSNSEQTQIAKYLDHKTHQIDDLIAKKERLIELLNEERTAIINQAVTKGLDPNVPMKDSGIEWLGEIPEHWEIRPLKYLGDCQNGISAGAEYFGSGYPFVSYGDVYKNMVLPLKVDGLANANEIERVRYSVKKGDVFFTRTSETIDEIGIASACLNTIENATFAGFVIRFRPFKKILFDGYSKYFFRSEIHRNFFTKEMNMVTRASLSQTLLKKLKVFLPPIQEQNEIAIWLDERINEIDSIINKSKKENELLNEYKTSLINEVVTGKVDVRVNSH